MYIFPVVVLKVISEIMTFKKMPYTLSLYIEMFCW